MGPLSILVLAWFPVVTAAGPQHGGTYTEAATARGVASHDYGRGVTFVDINGDGFEDIWSSNGDVDLKPYAFASHMFLNDGTGHFTEVSSGIKQKHLYGNWNAAFADIDNDGDQDALIISGAYAGNSYLTLYENRWNTEGRFVHASPRLDLRGDLLRTNRWWAGSFADINNDGWIDAIVTRIGGRPGLFINDGTGSFIESAPAYGAGWDVAKDSKNPAFLDYDDDGDMDLFMAGKEKFLLLENVGGTSYVDVSTLLPLDHLPNRPYVFAAVVEDFDQDGLDDLYMGRWNRQDTLWLNRGGTFEQHGRDIGLDAEVEVKPPPDHIQFTAFENTMGLNTFDLYEDGWPDLWIGTGDRGIAVEDILFCNLGGTFSRCTQDVYGPAPIFTRGHGGAAGDIDNDGDNDLMFALGADPRWDLIYPTDSAEDNRFYLREKPVAHNTARITLEGTTSNRDAIGAKVTITGTQTHYYRVRSNQGFGNANAKSLVVALHDATQADVTVLWPSGATTNTTINAGQQLHIVE